MKSRFLNLAVIVSILLPAVSFAQAMHGMASSPDADKAPLAIQYLDTMVEHHLEGIVMFELAAEKAGSQELRDLGLKMAADQRSEIPVLQQLRNEIDPDAPAAVNRNLPGMGHMDMSHVENLAGKEFDRTMLEMIIEHHQGALDMSRMAADSSGDQRVRDIAENIIQAQKAEIALMTRMLSEVQ